MKPPKKLLKHWYDKLAATGFQDIESPNDPDVLKRWHSHDFNYANVGNKHKAERMKSNIESSSRYYALAQTVLQSYAFESELERNIWELHTSGLSVRAIGAKLNRHHSGVHKVIQRIQRVSCLKP